MREGEGTVPEDYRGGRGEATTPRVMEPDRGRIDGMPVCPCALAYTANARMTSVIVVVPSMTLA